MTTIIAMLVLALACWLLRVLFIAVVPAERLPLGFRAALDHLAPAVLAALIAVEIDSATREESAQVVALVLATVVAIAVAARLTRSLGLAIALSIGATLFIDLVVG